MNKIPLVTAFTTGALVAGVAIGCFITAGTCGRDTIQIPAEDSLTETMALDQDTGIGNLVSPASLLVNEDQGRHPYLAPEKMKTVNYSSSKVYFYGEEVPLKDPLLVVVPEDGTEAKLYMPAKELLEYMNFNVEWDEKKGSVSLTMNGYSGMDNGTDTGPAVTIKNDADRTALDIMQRTGNWRYIEPYLPRMSREGIDAVAACYNSKHMNPAEHKKAADYYSR